MRFRRPLGTDDRDDPAVVLSYLEVNLIVAMRAKLNVCRCAAGIALGVFDNGRKADGTLPDRRRRQDKGVSAGGGGRVDLVEQLAILLINVVRFALPVAIRINAPPVNIPRSKVLKTVGAEWFFVKQQASSPENAGCRASGIGCIVPLYPTRYPILSSTDGWLSGYRSLSSALA